MAPRVWLSWICATLTEFRLRGFASAGSICSLSGLTSCRPSANPLNPHKAFKVFTIRLLKTIEPQGLIVFNCRRRDLNPHRLPHTPLKRARIPIPPLRHRIFNFQDFRCGVGGRSSASLSKNVTFNHLFLGRVPLRHKQFILFSRYILNESLPQNYFERLLSTPKSYPKQKEK